MARRLKRHRDISLTPQIVILNILIAVVIILLVYFTYKYITVGEVFPQISTTTPETIDEQTIPTEEETTTTTTSYISMTKAITTTPEPVTDEQNIEAQPVAIWTDGDSVLFEKDIFIGDSITTGFASYGYLPNENVFAKIGLNPESALDLEVNGKTIVTLTEEKKPQYVYIMLGTNGLSYLSGDYMVNKMKLLIDELRKISPESSIVILTIPPVTKEHELNKPEENIDSINLYNELLKTLANEENCNLVDICELLKDENGYLSPKYAEQDGLHFLPDAYKAVLNELKRQFKLL